VEKFKAMEFSTFFFIILSIYACYYLILLVLDRFSGGGRSEHSPAQTVYSFDPTSSVMPGLESAQAKDLLHPVTYLPQNISTDDEDIEIDDSDFKLIYLPDDEIEPSSPSSEDTDQTVSSTSANPAL
jgi:hypothetical protein